MIDKTEARAIAYQFINSGLSASEELEIADADTIEKDFGWVFFYNTKSYLETGRFSHRLTGNGPLIVDRTTGEVSAFGTGVPFDQVLKGFEPKRSVE